jgi:maltose alpha-D-glucosyltransferase/alpha-amylase
MTQKAEGPAREKDFPDLELAVRFWYFWVSVAFLRTYLDNLADSPILPREPDELRILLDTYLLEKAIYELGYEINNRPDWVRIPLRGILNQIETLE